MYLWMVSLQIKVSDNEYGMELSLRTPVLEDILADNAAMCIHYTFNDQTAQSSSAYDGHKQVFFICWTLTHKCSNTLNSTHSMAVCLQNIPHKCLIADLWGRCKGYLLWVKFMFWLSSVYAVYNTMLYCIAIWKTVMLTMKATHNSLPRRQIENLV